MPVRRYVLIMYVSAGKSAGEIVGEGVRGLGLEDML